MDLGLKDATVVVNGGTKGMGRAAAECFAAYGPAKEGVRCLTKVAARELGPDGIRVNAICPAAKTRLFAAWADANPELAAAEEAKVPLRHFGDPDVDIPRVAVMLASEYTGFVTGHTVMVDGGSCRF